MKSSISYVIREMKIKTTMRYHYTAIRRSKSELSVPNSGKNMNTKWYNYVWETVWQFLTKVNIILPYNPAI